MKNRRSLMLLGVVLMVILAVALLSVHASAANDIWDGTVAEGFASGTGAENDPYVIATGAQLAYLAKQVNAGTSYSGCYFKLANDIYLNDTTNWESWNETAPKNTWTPIGTSSKSFYGTFDGDGHAVYGVYINNSIASYQGLFGYSNGTIQNLGVEKSYIRGSYYVGGVCGKNYEGTVVSCYNTGTVSGSGSVGGVCGYNRGSDTIKDCYNTGTVSGSNGYVGGVCGDNDGIIIDCYNTGTVSGSEYVGGVCGRNYGGDSTISNCYNTGAVSGNQLIGGVCGENQQGNVKDCYNTGTVSGSGSSVGGVCGSENLGTISNCYNTGTVIGSGSYVGGVCGYNTYGDISSCYNTGTVSGSGSVGGVCGYNNSTIANCYNTGTVSGSGAVGGVCGWLYNGTIKNCYNTGAVSGSNGYVGGVCGENGGTITNCYNTGTVSGSSAVGGVCGYNYGTVTGCYNTGTVSGSSCVGGVCGQNYKGTIGNCGNCYNTGSVSGSSYVGGVCGRFYSGTIKNCYYLTGCAKDGNGMVQFGVGNGTQGETTADVSGSTTGLSDAAMKLQSSFVGFDFDTIWTIGAITGYDYPTLRWQKNAVVHTHTYAETSHTNADCTTKGTIVCTCSCGATTTYYTPALGHSYVSAVVKEATCTETGTIRYTCSRCGASYDVTTYSEHSYEHTVSEPTCTEDGADIYTCSKCGDVQRKTIPAAHNYISEVTKKATETENGVITYTCAKCGQSYTEEIPARPAATVLLIQDRLPWSGDNAVSLMNRLLQSEYITGWDATTTSGAENIDFTEYTVIYISNDQTTATYNQLSALNTKLTDYAKAGGTIVYGACDHGWAGGLISYLLPGGVKKIQNISMHNYILDDDHAIVKGTLTDNKALTNDLLLGTYCSHTSFDLTTVPEGYNVILQDGNGNPTLVEYPLGDGTVILSGLTWEFYYTRIYRGSTTYSKNVYDDLIVYAAGLSKVEVCEHQYDAGEVVAPTCTEIGYTLHTCVKCKKTYKDTFVDATGHTFGEWTVDKTADCENEGSRHQTCSKCQEAITEVIEPTGHKAGEWIIDKQATAAEVGSKHKECTVCRKTLVTVEIPKTETEDGVPGDITGDGIVNAKDLLRARKYFAGWKVEFDKVALDANGDGTINAKDLLRLRKYFAGWDVEIFYGKKSNKAIGGITIWDGTVAEGFASGTGAENDPYMIATGAQLAYLAKQVNSGTSYSGSYFKLANDIYLNDTANWESWNKTAPQNTWTPIGTTRSRQVIPFSGTFDGDGHAAYGIYICNSLDFQGLFGCSIGTIKNLGIEKSYICGNSKIGGVCGKNSNGIISNCYNTSMVSGSNCVGGVCGYNVCGYKYGAIKSCYNVGAVSGSNYVGGVCGVNDYGTVSNCYNVGVISGNYEIGGVCGCIKTGKNGAITNCYNTGTVSGSSAVGGVCGYKGDDYKATISNCYNTGTISGSSDVGGVCGFNYGTITSCYNTGVVSGSSDVGGVCGFNNGGGIIACYNISMVSGDYYAGGVCGYQNKGTIGTSYNAGTVSGRYYYVGGVCGVNYDIITNCYYLTGCAKDGNGIEQYGVGNKTQGQTTADVSGVTAGLSDAELKLQASFVGFDFNTVWTIGAITGYDYPTLQ